MKPVQISAVIPVYYGDQTLPALVAELQAAADSWKSEGLPIELAEAIFVDNASPDRSAQVLADLQRKHSWMRTVILSKNIGQHPATAAGLLQSRGDWVVTLDCDLTHRPDYIRPMLVHAVSHALDLVYARPTGAVHESVFRDGSSWFFKRAMGFVTGDRRIADFSSFRVIRGNVARAAAAVAVHGAYLDVVLGWFTTRIGTHPAALKDRRYIESGVSGYNLWRLLLHGWRMVVSAEAPWLRFLAGISLTVTFLCVVGAMQMLGPVGITKTDWLYRSVPVMVGTLLAAVPAIYLITNARHLRNKPAFFEIDRSGDAPLKASAPGNHSAASRPTS